MFTKEEIIKKLADLRQDYELSDGDGPGVYGITIACMLYDVCEVLGLQEGEIQCVMGSGWFILESEISAFVSNQSTPGD